MRAYVIERANFRKYYDMSVTDTEAEIIVKKLVRHFTIEGPVNLKFRGSGDCGRATAYTMTLSHNPSIGVVVHEVGHTVNFRTGGGRIRHGTKKWFRLLTRIDNYGDKMGWWKDEISRRTALPPYVPPPTEVDMRAMKIEKVRGNIARYEKKVRFYSNKIKRAQRSLRMLERYYKLSNTAQSAT